MTWSRCGLALIVLGALTAEAPGQFFPPPFAGPVLVPNGIGFRYAGRHLAVSGFLGGYSSSFGFGYGFGFGPFGYRVAPYSIIQNRVSVQIVTPQVIVAPRRLTLDEEYDLSGVDLDRVPSSRIWGDLAERRPEPPPKARPPVPPPPPPVKKKEPEPPPPPVPPKDELMEPRDNPAEEAKRLLALGERAFRNEEYGLAELRFTQAHEIDKTLARAYFLAAQADIALGKYRVAVKLLQEGLRREPNWPNRDFRPRKDLYAGHDADWKEHYARLARAHKDRPEDGDFLFLLGYLEWFDGRRADARDWFRLARLHMREPFWADLFLKAGVIAAK